ncbi:MAG TPA: hypothetical protein VM598_05540 [Bdellovibrionota bacterium]|nr:hypothetical protein [Bdellovibrionota bacterium]
MASVAFAISSGFRMERKRYRMALDSGLPSLHPAPGGVWPGSP